MKNLTKKLTALILALSLMLGLCAFARAEKDQYKVGIILLVENGAFMDMKAGLISGLAAEGFVEGENLTIDYQCAYGDMGTLAQICSSMDDGSYDAVFTVATPATQNFVGLESETPCVFCSVAAPVAAQVMSALDTPDMNATGTSNAIPAGDIIAMGLTITPGVKTFGLVYCTSEVNAVNAMNNAKAYLDANGFAYVEATVNGRNELEITTLSGCLATLAMSDVAIGEQTAQIGAKVLRGTPVAEIPAIVVPADIVSVNRDTLAALNLTLPEALYAIGEVQMLPAE